MGQFFTTLTSGLAMINLETMMIVLLIILVLFGGSKIPQLMRGVGRGISEFQEGIREGKDTIKKGIDETRKAPEDEPSRTA